MIRKKEINKKNIIHFTEKFVEAVAVIELGLDAVVIIVYGLRKSNDFKKIFGSRAMRRGRGEVAGTILFRISFLYY